MSTSTKPATMAPTSNKGVQQSPSLDEARSTVQRRFVQLALNMGWQLAVVVLVPVIIGAQIDNALNTTSHIFVYIGLALALLGTILVLWRSMQKANSLPVPKLSDEQKQAIKKAYEEEDDK